MSNDEEIFDRLLSIQNRHFRYFMTTQTVIIDYILITHNMAIHIVKHLPADIHNDICGQFGGSLKQVA